MQMQHQIDLKLRVRFFHRIYQQDKLYTLQN